jgi:hypothetical protein
MQHYMTDKKLKRKNKGTGKSSAENEKKDLITEAHRIAEEDMETDADLSTKPQPGDDLDEGELARLEGED